uniref:Uncharacterized protein n=1 Tax=Heliothis virescens TaxID=7102 RepID=A0A2A4J7T4_HELVI
MPNSFVYLCRSRTATPERQDSPVVTPSRSSRITRSRSRTPERKEKGVAESPKLEAITESPTKSSNTESSSSSSPSRRSLRSRSRTPEIEVVSELVLKPPPRSLRSRSKTPEKLMTPRVESSARKKSLSRMVLEHNTFAKTKQTDKMDTDIPEEKSDTAIECTPMKTLKQIPSLMDVTLSPIVNKSVLQSSTDTTISESAEKDIKSDKSTPELDLKPLPAFTTLHETCIEKSVLHSYASSVADTSVSIREEKVVITEKSQSVLKPLPAFTLNETEFDKSVLHSYESSVAETSSIQEDKDETQPDTNTSKPFAAFVQMIQTDYEKSVLHSAESSAAENSKVFEDSKVQEASSLMTNDSDVDMEENVESNKSAAEQKEKEKIVEIEREIGEIQNMSDEDAEESSNDDEEVIEDEDDDENEDEAEDEASGSSSFDSESSPTDEENDEVISIDDSDDSSDKLQIDEHSNSTQSNIQITEVNEQGNTPTEQITNINDTENVESSVDPLNQANYSLMTDDNSVAGSDKSDMNLNYSGESDKANVSGEIAVKDMETEPEQPVQIEITVETESKTKEHAPSLSEVDSPKQLEVAPTIQDENVTETISSESKIPSVEPKDDKQTEIPAVDKITEATDKEPIKEIPMVIEEEPKPAQRVLKLTELIEAPQTTQKKPEVTQKVAETTEKVPLTTEKVAELTDKEGTTKQETAEKVPEVTDKQETTEKVPQTEKVAKITDVEETEKLDEVEKVEKPTRGRKRGKSVSSNKSTTDTEMETEIRTPVTRKRTQSTASNKSVDTEKTPENAKTETPTRRRAKTPTSTEVRKIITRRVSREMSERLDESKVLDESVLTPKRRSTRSRSKNIDDNESVASESSVASIKSKASEDAGDRAVRKGRKSVLVSKPELSVIPEVIVEEGSKDADNVINEYSSSRRLTRHQKAVLESWLEPQPSPRRRLSTASRTSRSIASEVDDDDASSTHSAAFDVQPIDRISLLNKTDFEARLGRAASETKTVPRAAKINRRVSVDVAGSPDVGSPVLGSESPARGRRKSFNRACEALHTPKGRRASTEVRQRGDTESPVDSPAVSESEAATVTPARRTRRAASNVSSTSQANSETGKR